MPGLTYIAIKLKGYLPAAIAYYNRSKGGGDGVGIHRSTWCWLLYLVIHGLIPLVISVDGWLAV
ncbi:hypothetical protein ES705_41389 [subsurface metagenome]